MDNYKQSLFQTQPYRLYKESRSLWRPRKRAKAREKNTGYKKLILDLVKAFAIYRFEIFAKRDFKSFQVVKRRILIE